MNKLTKKSICIITLLILIIVALIIALIVFSLKPKSIKQDFSKHALDFIKEGTYSVKGEIKPTKLYPEGLNVIGIDVIRKDKDNNLIGERNLKLLNKSTNKVSVDYKSLINYTTTPGGAVYRTMKSFVNGKQVVMLAGYASEINSDSITFSAQGNYYVTGTHHYNSSVKTEKNGNGLKATYFIGKKILAINYLSPINK